MKNRDEKRKNGEKRRKNRELYLCAGLFVCLFSLAGGYLAYEAVANREAMFNNSYNSRQRVLAGENTRGTIYAGSGEVLAATVTGEDGKEIRQYPYGAEFAHVVGYTGKGKTGIEELENYWLSNTDISGREQLQNELEGRKNPGSDVYTTLDTALQEAAGDALGLYRGAVVVTEVKTGRILAMVSKPDYDPNRIAEDWEKLNQEEEAASLLNRATQGLYPPGSTFKIVTALAYIRQFPDTWQRYQFTCTGSYTHGDSRIRCYHGSVHGQVDLMSSFAKSCNSSFANLGMSMDRGLFGETIDSLMFHQELPLDLPYKQASVSLSETSTDDEVIQTAIGQGTTQITPVHLNLITAAVANGGKLMRPVLVDRVEGASGRILRENNPSVYRELMTEEEAGILTSFMEDVVQEGTGRKLKDRPYTAAGKTGSAEFSEEKGESHAWFTGFAPAEDPEIAVTVIVEKAGSGSDYAVPLARQVFDAWFANRS
ncbi:MAG: penicillin-binding transpeptidase domain-containing protein [Eubacteriales bacterium]|nr:penicillin-binding transpeptidase domain-containing protein [Eubacteriales bacterium]